jgi:hypothetical protein
VTPLVSKYASASSGVRALVRILAVEPLERRLQFPKPGCVDPAMMAPTPGAAVNYINE